MAAELRSIRIVAVPDGEAPLWVREKWRGLELPLARGEDKPDTVHTSGVLSGPRNRFVALLWGLMGRLKKETGFAVEVAAALDILEPTAPEAARWWRENVPRLMRPRRKFLFHASVCEPVAGPRTS